MAPGYIPVYNHSHRSNCEYDMPARQPVHRINRDLGRSSGDFPSQLIGIRTIRRIEKGEELFINYNGNWNDDKPVWFDPK